MLTSFLTIFMTSLTLLLLVLWTAARRSARRKTVFTCDTCDSRDCLCREKR